MSTLDRPCLQGKQKDDGWLYLFYKYRVKKMNTDKINERKIFDMIKQR